MDSVDFNNNNESLSENIPVQPEPQNYKLEFIGTAGEYFRIWIVNTFLTILTAGIYAAWAKVRNRQYFYKHTILDGQSFDYTANPLAIFKGYLIIGAGIFLYYVTGAFNPLYNGIVVIIFYLAIPFLIYKSLRFFAHNSAFRNIHFRFLGTLENSYKTYLLYPFLIPFTLGIVIPYWAFQRKKYFFDNITFGTTHNSFKGRPGPFYKVYTVAGGVMMLVFVILFGMLAVLFFPLIKAVSPADSGMFLIFPIIMYLTIMVLYTAIQQYLYAWTTNYCWTYSNLGKLRFQSTLKAHQLIWIHITNILAIVLSLGLLIPWAKVRRTRYIFDNLTVITEHSLNDFTAATESDESAYGDAATDFFDIEIGL